MKKISKLLVVSTIVLALTGCKKGDENDPLKGTCLITSSKTQNENSGTTYSYDSQGRITSTTYGSGSVYTVDQSDGMITRDYIINNDLKERYITVFAADGRVSLFRREFINSEAFGPETKAVTWTYAYNGLNMTETIRRLGTDGQPIAGYTQVHNYTWDNNGNIIKWEFQNQIREYTYYTDKLRSAYPQYNEISKGRLELTDQTKNLLKSSTTKNATTGAVEFGYEYTYSFDEHDRITRRTMIASPQGNVYTEDYTYTCR